MSVTTGGRSTTSALHVADLQQLFQYSDWANGKLFEALAPLSTEQFTQAVAGSYESIRNTLVHAMSAEWGWLERCGGFARGPKLDPNDYPTLASVRDTWRNVQEHMLTFLSGLRDEDLSRPVEFTLGQSAATSMAMGELLQHAVIHNVHHRGQVAL
ncbi:MAG TPA: DinB family protein, partial [Gemmatimonadaceae bacterium]|nr:DinB family protein [Gemmatimonadaceae bacterium]